MGFWNTGPPLPGVLGFGAFTAAGAPGFGLLTLGVLGFAGTWAVTLGALGFSTGLLLSLPFRKPLFTGPVGARFPGLVTAGGLGAEEAARRE
ncbi:hypothetical protein [Mycobacterium sp. NPDC050853]|uniref:hypothetical protein n=1 Tax=Mycobacterium sp. NPDC050853 TaxID=3155160 RepID=UPI003402A80F